MLESLRTIVVVISFVTLVVITLVDAGKVCVLYDVTVLGAAVEV